CRGVLLPADRGPGALRAGQLGADRRGPDRVHGRRARSAARPRGVSGHARCKHGRVRPVVRVRALAGVACVRSLVPGSPDRVGTANAPSWRMGYPVQLDVTSPPRYDRIQIALRLAIALALGWLGSVVGWLPGLVFFALPVIAATVV